MTLSCPLAGTSHQLVERNDRPWRPRITFPASSIISSGRRPRAEGRIVSSVTDVSRLYPGVHYPTDVLASWTLAAASIAALQLLIFGRNQRGRRMQEQH
jgi:membrane-associated phospholipid phosphatase